MVTTRPRLAPPQGGIFGDLEERRPPPPSTPQAARQAALNAAYRRLVAAPPPARPRPLPVAGPRDPAPAPAPSPSSPPPPPEWLTRPVLQIAIPGSPFAANGRAPPGAPPDATESGAAVTDVPPLVEPVAPIWRELPDPAAELAAIVAAAPLPILPLAVDLSAAAVPKLAAGRRRYGDAANSRPRYGAIAAPGSHHDTAAGCGVAAGRRYGSAAGSRRRCQAALGDAPACPASSCPAAGGSFAAEALYRHPSCPSVFAVVRGTGFIARRAAGARPGAPGDGSGGGCHRAHSAQRPGAGGGARNAAADREPPALSPRDADRRAGGVRYSMPAHRLVDRRVCRSAAPRTSPPVRWCR